MPPRGLQGPERFCEALRIKPSPIRALPSVASDADKRRQPSAAARTTETARRQVELYYDGECAPAMEIGPRLYYK